MIRIVISIVFQLYHSYDLFQQEKLSFLLLFYTEYLKYYFNTFLIEKILKVIIYLVVSKNFEGIVMINMLKILKELFISDIIEEKLSQNINDLLSLL